MNQKHMLQHWLPSVIAGLALSSGSAMAQFVIADFATDASALGGTGGSATPTTSWAATGNPGGSLYVTCPWVDKTGWQDAQLSFNQTIDMSKYVNLEADIKVDIAHSTLTDGGDYGGYQLVAQNWNAGQQGWTVLGGGTISNLPGWQHISVPVAAYQGTALQIVVAFDANQYGTTTPHAGTCSYWVDNVELTSQPMALPKIVGVKPAAPSGLTLLPTGTGNYQRTMVYPGAAGGDYSWHNKTFPVTYSFTIAYFPAVPSYIANLFIIPTASVNVPNGLGDTSIDWNAKYGLFFNVGAPTNLLVTNWNVNLTIKTNDSGRNAQFQLTNYNYGQLPVGTWTVKFTDNTHLTVTAPDASSKDLVIPADVEAAAADVSDGTSAMVYIGGQNNSTANIGIPMVISQIGITNGAIISDKFTASPLNTNSLWSVLQSSSFGVTVQTNDQLSYVYWQTPNDGGFSGLTIAGSLTGTWYDINTPGTWYVVQPDADTIYHQTLVTKSSVHAALNGAENQMAFYRLVKRQMSGLQVLFDGETNAPNTVTGKTGTPAPVYYDTPVNVTINAVDSTYHIVSTGDAIQLTTTDSGAMFTANPNLQLGTVVVPFIFETTGPQSVTATDANFTPAITATSATVTVQ